MGRGRASRCDRVRGGRGGARAGCSLFLCGGAQSSRVSVRRAAQVRPIELRALSDAFIGAAVGLAQSADVVCNALPSARTLAVGERARQRLLHAPARQLDSVVAESDFCASGLRRPRALGIECSLPLFAAFAILPGAVFVRGVRHAAAHPVRWRRARARGAAAFLFVCAVLSGFPGKCVNDRKCFLFIIYFYFMVYYCSLFS